MTKLFKKDLNKNLHLGEGNTKLIGAEEIEFLTWSIKAIDTCPYATETCKYVCYAMLDEKRRPNVLQSHLRNLEESKKDNFIKDMVELLNYHLQRPKYQNKVLFIRIHQAGDFYNLNYLKAWAQIANTFKGNNRILFQAYTKSLPLLKQIDLKATNIKFVYSVMSDTNQSSIEEAKALELTLFIAKHESKIKKEDNICGGNCGPCVKCYLGNDKEIVIGYHGCRRNSVV